MMTCCCYCCLGHAPGIQAKILISLKCFYYFMILLTVGPFRLYLLAVVEWSINLPKDVLLVPGESLRRSLLERSFVQRTLLKLFRLCIVSGRVRFEKTHFHSGMNFPGKSIHWKREFLPACSRTRQTMSELRFFSSSIHIPGHSHSGGVIALCDFRAFYEFMSHFYENL